MTSGCFLIFPPTRQTSVNPSMTIMRNDISYLQSVIFISDRWFDILSAKISVALQHGQPFAAPSSSWSYVQNVYKLNDIR